MKKSSSRKVEKLGGDATKHPEVQMTKYEVSTPLLAASMCYDKTVHQTYAGTYGKVVCTVRASALDIVAFLFDYDANFNKYDVNRFVKKYGVLVG